ncbi:MAG TPA: FAD-dependent monooxygenase [Solirubrobacteraceae bacterium]|nr:FAD-dependent monooxygenase [Solirubrobacteraceae bacterium]
MTENFPVVIVGAGPAGLAAAIALGRRGIESLIVDRRLERSSLPRATTVSTRSMELIRSWGLEEEILAGGIEVEWLMWESPTLARAEDGVAIEVGLPTRAQAALISPTAPACVPQDHLERVLLDHLWSLGPTRIELGTTFVDLEDHGDHVRVILREAAGRTRVVTARYVVAADGAHSRIRNALGIPMRGSQDLLRGANALIRAPLWSVLGDRRYGIYATTQPGAEAVFLPAGPGDRWGFSVAAPAGPGAPAVTSKQEMIDRVRLAAGIPDLPIRIERIGSFTSAAQIADRFGEARTFLVGDAAHRVTPRGGTGMNTAIHGGHHLGWKLAWVLRGWAGADLLDSYELEHRPVAEHNVARSADELGSRRATGEELRVDLGGRIDHHWLMTGNGRESTLDLIGPGLTLFTGPLDAGWREAAARHSDRPPILVRRLDEITARAMRIHVGGALLVRPDGVPTGWWTGNVEPGPALAAAVADVGAAQRIARAA